MRKFSICLVVIISLITIMGLVAGCSSRFVPEKAEGALPSPSVSSSSGSADGLVRANDGSNVAIDIEWDGEETDPLVFDVAMNTHSVNLDQYDLGTLAILRDDGGNEYHPASWDSAPGGHHRRGVLTFPLPGTLKDGQASYIEIVIHDVAGIPERVMKWEL